MTRKSNLFNEIWLKIPKPIRNRYILGILMFLCWIMFFDKHDLFTQMSLQRAINKMESDIVYYNEKIIEARAEQIDLNRNMEKFAREKYFMSKSNEDVFIIE